MVELRCENLSVWCIWLYVFIISRTSFRVNPHSIVGLNVKELLAQGRQHVWSLSDRNEIGTHNYLVRKRTRKHLAKLTKWFSCILSTSLHGTCDCTLLSRQVRVSEWIQTYSLPECQGTSCSKQSPYLKFKWPLSSKLGPYRKFKWQQQDSNPKQLSAETKTEPFDQNGQLIEMGRECLFVRCIWQYGHYHVTYEFQSESRIYKLPECQGTPCSKQSPYPKFK